MDHAPQKNGFQLGFIHGMDHTTAYAVRIFWLVDAPHKSDGSEL